MASDIQYQLRQRLSGFTPYQVAQMIAAETDPDDKAFRKLKQRWQRWLSGEGLKTINNLEIDLDHLGLEIVIRQKQPEKPNKRT